MNLKKKQFLIDRYGNRYFYEGKNTPASIHHAIAERLLPDDNDALFTLQERGWLSVGSNFISAPYTLIEITICQKRVLKKLGFENYYLGNETVKL